MTDVTASGAGEEEAFGTSVASGRSGAPAESGFIVVRLERSYHPVDGETLLDVVSRDQPYLNDLRTFLRDHNLDKSTRSILDVPPGKVLEWEARAERVTELKPRWSLLQYWRIDARSQAALQPGFIAGLADQLRETQGVATARVEYRNTPPTGIGAVDYSDDPESKFQTHLDPPLATAPGGINAKALWLLGADGTGVGLADVEYDWWDAHPDLAAQNFKKLGTAFDASFRRHGTAVLGVVAAIDNAVGVVGIVPRPRDITMSSARSVDFGEVQASAIANAIDAGQPGDVILLELQANDKDGTDLPAEFVDDTFDAIRLASALGFVVVEPAGNGKSSQGVNLDSRTNDAGALVLLRGARESGAIMVAASTRGPVYVEYPSSNYGTRVDCFAPGECVATCNEPRFSGDPEYRHDFAETSAASAIVAGAAVLLQSFWKGKTGNVIGPLQMRALLSDRTLNTNPATGSLAIGVMPDLGAIADAKLPDIYIRDNVGDNGDLPSSGTLSLSPDIIVRAAPVVGDLQVWSGEGSGNENSEALSDSVTAGSDHYLYVRLRNRGGEDALGVTVDLYYGDASTLVTPDHWKPIGTTPAFDVPADQRLVVSPELRWNAANVPPTGHYCFVAVANHQNDLGPNVPPNLQTWDYFVNLVANNNNIAWRNFNVVYPTVGGQPLPLRFLVRGDSRRAREFNLEVLAHPLPSERMELVVPIDLAERMEDDARARIIRNDGERVHFDLADTAGLRAARVTLPGDASYPCEIILTPPWKEAVRRRVVVRQNYRGTVVGAITWVIKEERVR